MKTLWKRKCTFCGDSFFSERNTAKFCPDKQCRVKSHRRHKAVLEIPLSNALVAISEIGKQIEGQWSYEAVEALQTISAVLEYNDITNAGTWWRCKICWQARTTKFPDKAGCTDGKDHDWHYQKPLMR